MSKDRGEAWWRDFTWEDKGVQRVVTPFTFVPTEMPFASITSTLQKISCPSCGAPYNPTKPKCDYCGGYYTFGRSTPTNDEDLKRMKLEALKEKIEQVKARIEEVKQQRLIADESLKVKARW
jgi:hypothetical protein